MLNAIDSLKELNFKLLVEITELRKKNAEISVLRKKFAEKSIITDSTPEPIHSSTQLQKEPVMSITSSQQDIVDDNLANYVSISPEYATEILLTPDQEKSSIFQNIAHLYEKACDAEYKSIKANQAEILCWSNFIIVLDKSLDELMVRDKNNSLNNLPKTDIGKKTLPEIEVSTLTISQSKLQISAELAQSKASYALPKLFPFKRKLSKEMRNSVINKLTSHFTDLPKLDKNYSIDTEGEHQTDSYWVLSPHCPLCRENHMSIYDKWWLDSRSKNTYYLYCINLKELGIPYDDVLKAYF
ncbi:12189_t:CDS:2, partial [Gigaspora margarita]